MPPAPELRTLLHLHMLERGYSYARRGFIALSLPLSEAEIDGFAEATEEFLAEINGRIDGGRIWPRDVNRAARGSRSPSD